MTKILLGTTNQAKQERLGWCLSSFRDLELVSPREVSLALEVEETGRDFQENATIKALAYSSAFGGLAIASDGGASIPALGEDWDGLLTHRFAGKEAGDTDRLDAIIQMMEKFSGEDRKVFWNEAVALADNGKLVFSLLETGERGFLQKGYDRSNVMSGFWLANIWLCPRFDKTYACLTPEERGNQDFTWPRLKARLEPLIQSNLLTL